jgi:hypothetical protein
MEIKLERLASPLESGYIVLIKLTPKVREQFGHRSSAQLL